ncbi:MAG: hypothetical protein QOJ46_328 [bacterium]
MFGAVLALCATSALPAHAGAAPTSSKPVVVATDGPVKLLVNDEDDQLCLGMEPGRGSASSCDSAESGTVIVGGTDRGTRLVGAAVPAAATTIEVRRAGQLLSAGATVAGAAYTGKHAGTLRYALVRLPAGAREDGLRVRAIAASGALVGVLSFSGARELVSDRRRLLSGRSGAIRWSISSQQSSTLEPSLIDLGHETLSRCLEVSVRGGRQRSSSETCVGAAPRDESLFGATGQEASVEDRCTPQFRLLHGVVAAAAQRVVVLLGDGTSRTARTRPLGDGKHVAYALVVPRTAAVRSVTVQLGDAGTKLLPLAGAPLAVLCAISGAGDPALGIAGESPFFMSLPGALPPVEPVGPVTTIASSPAMRVADGPGDSLCVAVADRPFTALGCGVVSPLFSQVLGTYDDINAPHAFAVVLPSRVATLRIAGPAGKGTRDIPTLPGTGYAGPYAGYVRFAAGSIADFRELSRIEYLDASGTVLYAEPNTGSLDELTKPRFTSPRRIAGRAKAPSLWQTTLRAGEETLHCLALTRGEKPARNAACQAGRTSRSVLLDAPCETHRLTVAVAVDAGTRVFATSGASRVRPIGLRRGAGILTLPARTGLRALTFVRKGRRNRVRVDAPPGTRQCGWTAAPDIRLR